MLFRLRKKSSYTGLYDSKGNNHTQEWSNPVLRKLYSVLVLALPYQFNINSANYADYYETNQRERIHRQMDRNQNCCLSFCFIQKYIPMDSLHLPYSFQVYKGSIFTLVFMQCPRVLLEASLLLVISKRWYTAGSTSHFWGFALHQWKQTNPQQTGIIKRTKKKTKKKTPLCITSELGNTLIEIQNKIITILVSNKETHSVIVYCTTNIKSLL